MKLVFCGTPQFAVPTLKALLDAGHEVALAVSQPDRRVGRDQLLTAPPVKQAALAAGLPVVQPEKIRANEEFRAQDEYGKWFEMDGEEVLSRCFQHEIDHVDGVQFIFRMSALKRDLVLRKIRKLIRNGEW